MDLLGISRVMALKDGQQAIDEFHRQGGADAFDIILSDLQMPYKVPSTAAWLLPLEHLQELPYDTSMFAKCFAATFSLLAILA